jgi:hypothetical protein
MSAGAATCLVAFAALGKSLQMDLLETRQEHRLRRLLQPRAYVLVSALLHHARLLLINRTGF